MHNRELFVEVQDQLETVIEGVLLECDLRNVRSFTGSNLLASLGVSRRGQ
jgi:hypothetical protein